ncbi:MAG: hypothetical protein WCP81_11760 [Actinomycetes bacterium]
MRRHSRLHCRSISGNLRRMQQSAPEAISFDLVLTHEDVRAFSDFIRKSSQSDARRNFWRSGSGVIAAMIIVFGIGFLLIVLSGTTTTMVLAAWAMAASFGGVLLTIVAIGNRAMMTRADTFNGRYTIDASGVTVQRAGYSSFVYARELLDVTVTVPYVFIRLTAGHAWVVPRRCIGGPEDQARALQFLAAIPRLQ